MIQETENNQSEIELINGIVQTMGKSFVEQKFSFIISAISKAIKKELSSIEMYERFFTDLIPTRKNIDIVFKNAVCSQHDFRPLFDSSEYLYHQWTANFAGCPLVKEVSNNIVLNIDKCEQVLDEFKLWMDNYPQIKGTHIIQQLQRDTAEIPLNQPINYSPKNLFVKNEIKNQLNNHSVLEVVQIKKMSEKIELRLESGDIILTRKLRYAVKPHVLQKWFRNFGISLSLISVVYLFDFGMPYCGRIIPIYEVLKFTHNGWGVGGILASHLSYMILLHHDKKEISFNNHPLCQSAILALARLEIFLNPAIF